MLGFTGTAPVSEVDQPRDDLGLQAAVVAIRELADKLPTIGGQRDSGSPAYDAFIVQVPLNGVPVQLLGFDMTRVEARVQASEAGVYVGKFSQLANITQDNPNGFPIPKTYPVDLKSVDAYYVRFIGDATTTATVAQVAVMVEKSGQGM